MPIDVGTRRVSLPAVHHRPALRAPRPCRPVALPVLLLALASLCAAASRAQAPASAPTGASVPATSAAPSPPTPPVDPLAAQLQRLKALQRERPGDGLLLYYEAMTLAQARRGDEALAVLQQLEGRRLGLVPPADAGFEALWPDAGFQALRQRLADAEPRTPDAPVRLKLDDPRLIPEGIAWDPRRHHHYIGSIAQRRVLQIDRRGRARSFSSPADGLDAVLGLAVDARRDRLCAISTNAVADWRPAAGSGSAVPLRNAIVCWPLADAPAGAATPGHLKRRALRIAVPEAQQLNDLAFEADGSIVATDSAAGTLWRWRPGARQATRLGEGGLRGANGIAVAPDGTLYVTLSTGIARVDPATGSFVRLPQPDAVVSGGIDGLYWYRGDLVGVQNGTNPGRVVRLHLGRGPDGAERITGLTVLQSHHHPLLAEPTTGTLVGDRLHLIANSHVAQLEADGRFKRPAELRGTVVLAVPLQPKPARPR